MNLLSTRWNRCAGMAYLPLLPLLRALLNQLTEGVCSPEQPITILALKESSTVSLSVPMMTNPMRSSKSMTMSDRVMRTIAKSSWATATRNTPRIYLLMTTNVFCNF